MYNVLIVDDDTLMRDTLRAMISRFKNFQIIRATFIKQTMHHFNKAINILWLNVASVTRKY